MGRRLTEALFSFSCALAISLGFTAPSVAAQTLALSFDDGPHLHDTPILSAAGRNTALLAALARHQAKAILFVTANNGANQPEGLALARAWGEAGHVIGNHTMSHLDLNSAATTLAAYQQEVLDCDAVIRDLPGYRRWFRFTYLREGNTPEKRDGMRALLKAQGYRNAYVTLDTSDWRFNALLVQILLAHPDADVQPIKVQYIAHVLQRAAAYRALAQQLQGRDIPQMLLLHHNLINALWLDEVLSALKAQGWTFVDPETAFADPIYRLEPDRPVAGQSLLLSMARVLGLGRFPGWERLVDDADYEMALLKAQGF
ncbi:MAG: Polysaccharide deacetylase [Alphaproteobacteria bacterium ADurb.BinA280]|jgi:peptidoglycan/xylan/chitin deacetylase (PgdA/CDA1 family)|nr:MAG: Polysaccharide deacetylase [Alphaproteobacteria bacterium ADurb.BinA280]